MSDKYDKKELKRIAKEIRKTTIEMFYRAQYGHAGGSLSIVELLVALYFYKMKINPEEPKWEQRDRFILSKGHSCTSYYAVLAKKGFFSEEELKTYGEIDSILQGHPDKTKTPGVDYSSGSLGQGLSIGIGMAKGAKMLRQSFHTYVILGDGECQEGQVWEAAMAAPAFGLNNLTAILDYNRLQLAGNVNEFVPLEPLLQKWQAFGWDVVSIDGHDFDEIIKALHQISTKPKLIIANTVKGKGVSFMENDKCWHSHTMNAEQYAEAMSELVKGAN